MLSYTGRGGRRGVVYGGASGPGVVWHGPAPFVEDLVERGFRVAVPEVYWRERPPTDPEALGDFGAAREALGGGVFFVGFGVGGLWSRLAACSFARTLGAVDLGGALAFPRIDEVHPTQPLDLLPGLRTGLQVHVAGDDPAVDPVHVAELERRLVLLNHPNQVLVYPGVRSMEDERVKRQGWARACAFLGHLAAGG